MRKLANFEKQMVGEIKNDLSIGGYNCWDAGDYGRRMWWWRTWADLSDYYVACLEWIYGETYAEQYILEEYFGVRNPENYSPEEIYDYAIARAFGVIR